EARYGGFGLGSWNSGSLGQGTHFQNEVNPSPRDQESAGSLDRNSRSGSGSVVLLHEPNPSRKGSAIRDRSVRNGARARPENRPKGVAPRFAPRGYYRGPRPDRRQRPSGATLPLAIGTS